MEYVRIAILDAYDSVQAYMDNNVPTALHYYSDDLAEYLKGTAATYSFTAPAKHADSVYLKEGNKLSFRYRNKDYYMNIMHVERDEFEVTVEAYSLTFELLNEYRPAYKASSAMSFEQYLNVFDPEHVITLEINEVSSRNITHEWEGEDTILSRLFSLASVFSAELEFFPELNDDYSLKRIVMNVFQEHSDATQGVGQRRTDLILRYDKEISGITKKADITELYTAIMPTGRDGLTIFSLDKTEYDADGNVEYISPLNNTHIYAVQARDRFPSNLMANENERYIGVNWEYDTDNVNTLYGQALAQLKKNCVPKVSYEVEGYFDTGIGDTVTISDESFNPELYLEARVTEQHRSFTDPSGNKTTFDNFKELQSQIDESLLSRVEELIKQNKTYTAMISTDNGTVFRNGVGETTMTAHVRDTGGVELADNYAISWYKDGSSVYTGNPLTVSAEDVAGKSLYRFEAVDSSGAVIAFYEVTLVDVNDGTGVTITKTEITYQASASGTEIPTGEWSEDIPVVLTSRYLWTRTRVVYSDGTETISYSVGGKGEPGNGVVSTEITYQAHSSPTEKPTGEWTADIPPTNALKPYLWTRMIFTYVDETTTESYSVSSTLDGVNIGGRNLIKNSTGNLGSSVWNNLEHLEFYERGGVDDLPYFTYVRDLADTDEDSITNYTFPKKDINGETYTISGYVRANNSASTELHIGMITDSDETWFADRLQTASSGDWTFFSTTGTFDGAISDTENYPFFQISISGGISVDVSFCALKVETGNKATDWTPDPRDLQEGIGNAQTAADNAQAAADSTESRVSVAESTIEFLTNAIATLVVDENGESMMTQTPDGWRFDMSSINTQLNDAKDQLNNLAGTMTQVDETIQNLNGLANDLSQKTAYITMTTDDNGDPCIELGKSDNDFKVRITNTSIDFMEGSSRIAYLSNRSLYIEKAIIKDELQIGEGSGYVWKKRSNGHMGLRWVGG